MRYLESAVPNNYCENLAIDQNHSLNSRPRIGQYPNTATFSHLPFPCSPLRLSQSLFLSLYLLLYIYLSFCLSVYLSFSPANPHLAFSATLFIPSLSGCPPVRLCLCVCVYVCLSICLSVCLNVCLFAICASGINLQNLFRYQIDNFLKKKILLIIS